MSSEEKIVLCRRRDLNVSPRQLKKLIPEDIYEPTLDLARYVIHHPWMVIRRGYSTFIRTESFMADDRRIYELASCTELTSKDEG